MFYRICKPLKTNSFFLLGARNTGKSTFVLDQFLAKIAIDQVFQIDLLNEDLVDRYQIRPQRLVEDYIALKHKPEWVFIDEIQRVPALLNSVHQLIEKYKAKCILTGSSARKLKKLDNNLLGGRAYLQVLHPLTFLELGSEFDLSIVLHWGSLPKIFSMEADERAKFLRTYVQIYLKEEIRIEQLVREIEPFRNFLEVAAQQNGDIINQAKIARLVGVDAKTVNNYFSILEDTYVGFQLPSFHRSVRKQQIQHSKFYFFDLGVKRALDRTLIDRFSEGTKAFGRAFEHLVILELFRLNQYFERDFKLSYLKTKEGAEIDCILSRGRNVFAVEIKSYSKIDPDDIKKLKRLADDIDGSKAYLLSCDPIPSVIEGVRCLPWQLGIKEILNIETFP